jgi:transposase
MKFKTCLIADVPRVECPEHGVHSISFPWVSDKSHFTLLFEKIAIGVLQSASSQTQAMEILRFS